MKHAQSPWGEKATQFFYQLTPERILDALEESCGIRCTGRSFAHNSLENRVYELEIQLDEPASHPYDAFRIVKFYRPGRWSEEQILEEHRFLFALQEAELPVVAPIRLLDGKSLHFLENENIYYCVFPKIGGRAPDELSGSRLEQVGRLLARMHNVGANMKLKHRLSLNPENYILSQIEFLKNEKLIVPDLEDSYLKLAETIAKQTSPWFKDAHVFQIHGDCHLGNLLWGHEGPFWVDFDDSLKGAPVQDLWLLLPGRDEYAKQLLYQLIRAYELMREFDWSGLRLIEALRAMRMIHFSAWIGRRRSDPSFQRYFPNYGDHGYWATQLQDLREQLDYIQNHENFWLS